MGLLELGEAGHRLSAGAGLRGEVVQEHGGEALLPEGLGGALRLAVVAVLFKKVLCYHYVSP